MISEWLHGVEIDAIKKRLDALEGAFAGRRVLTADAACPRCKGGGRRVEDVGCGAYVVHLDDLCACVRAEVRP